MAVLRSCCSINEYRRAYPGHMEPSRVAAFLILAPHFPRSVAYSIRHAHDAASRIRSTVNPHTIEQAERILGRLNGQLTNADATELVSGDLSVFLRSTVAQIRVANEAIYKAYFLR
jgi:uncharacterized alpha-E superfamily protein